MASNIHVCVYLLLCLFYIATSDKLRPKRDLQTHRKLQGPLLASASALRNQVQNSITAATSDGGDKGHLPNMHIPGGVSHGSHHPTPHGNAHPLHGSVHHIVTNETLSGMQLDAIRCIACLFFLLLYLVNLLDFYLFFLFSFFLYLFYNIIYNFLGTGMGCLHTTQYTITNNARFFMCTGQTDIDLKNGMSIINLIGSRGYLPTCRVMHLMLWMHSVVNDENNNRKKGVIKDYFIDVGANIGSCSVHMASLGFPVVSVEPVIQHVNTIRGSADINPSFHIDVQHIGISGEDKTIRVDFGHGSRNWGATAFWEKQTNQTFETELIVKTLDQVIGHKKVALLKIDCEGCEWNAIKGGRRSLKRVPMIKIELVQPDYQSGNETVSAHDIVKHLSEIGFDLFVDVWNEQHLYFGKGGNDIMDIDKMFGSSKFNLKADVALLHQSAKKILESEIDPKTWDHRKFLKSYTDVIAIEKSISAKMKRLWLSQFNMR
jgi:FkbM family methyltransferase